MDAPLKMPRITPKKFHTVRARFGKDRFDAIEFSEDKRGLFMKFEATAFEPENSRWVSISTKYSVERKTLLELRDALINFLASTNHE
jgi:hypothetical protein